MSFDDVNRFLGVAIYPRRQSEWHLGLAPYEIDAIRNGTPLDAPAHWIAHRAEHQIARYRTTPYWAMRICCGDGHTDELYVAVIGANGVRQIHTCCQSCGELRRRVIPHAELRSLGIDIEAVPVAYDRRDHTPCAACGGTAGVEIHHWAPTHLFGDESYRWPTSPLCRDCHQRWHRIVTPRMQERRAS